MRNLLVQRFHCESSDFYSYLVIHSDSKSCAVIDPPCSDASCWRVISDTIRANDLRLCWLLHTTVEARQISGAEAFKENHVCAQSAIGASVEQLASGRSFDRVFNSGDRFQLGHAYGRVHFHPGANQPRAQYQFEDCVFLGDELNPLYKTWNNSPQVFSRELTA